MEYSAHAQLFEFGNGRRSATCLPIPNPYLSY